MREHHLQTAGEGGCLCTSHVHTLLNSGRSTGPLPLFDGAGAGYAAADGTSALSTTHLGLPHVHPKPLAQLVRLHPLRYAATIGEKGDWVPRAAAVRAVQFCQRPARNRRAARGGAGGRHSSARADGGVWHRQGGDWGLACIPSCPWKPTNRGCCSSPAGCGKGVPSLNQHPINVENKSRGGIRVWVWSRRAAAAAAAEGPAAKHAAACQTGSGGGCRGGARQRYCRL